VDTALQLWAGGFYLLNKIFLSRAERSSGNNKKILRIWTWSVYLIGLPAWVIIFISEKNWIAASIEAGGAPAMILGLIIAIRGIGKKPQWLDRLAIIAIIFGIGFSLYDFGGFNTINQGLELAMVIGFFIGTYLLAVENPKGYLFFMLMNASNATLMFIEHYPWLVVQQIVSLGFVLDAYINNKTTS